MFTDLLILLTLVVSGVAFYQALKKEFWRQIFLKIVSNSKTVFCMGWLLILITIALIDSIHYRSALDNSSTSQQEAQYGDIQTVLDLLCHNIKTNPEESYSAPMAIEGFSEVLIENKQDGTVNPGHQRLIYAGKHLNSKDDLGSDLLKKTMIALTIGLFLTFLLSVAFLRFLKWFRRTKLDNDQALPFGVKLTTLLFFLSSCLSLSCLIYLSQFYHVMGTGQIGNSTFWVALKSIRTAFIIGSLTTFSISIPAVTFGMMAGYLGGWVDDVIQYVYTTLSSIPNILLISAAMLIVQTKTASQVSDLAADQRLLYLCLVLGVTSWAGLCRLVRAEVLKLRDVEYVQSAKIMGLHKGRIMLKHLLPNVMHIVLIDIILSFSQLILTEAVLAYIGIGVHPSTQSFGNMINNAQEQMSRTPVIWWNLLAAFVFLFILVVPANIVGDAIRDALDPKLKKRS
jgi:peptide/nickel transport system permease protein